ncbi:family 16 glycoside hydrolase [Puia sp.]|jgi:hypothetical protein|uniref:family 16 glycoside hydrolase n=1 Tax=Puia sp. TaxID=2045100 RepID=UPI002F42C55A
MKYRTLSLIGVALLMGAAPRFAAFRWDAQHSKQLFNGKDLTGWKHVGPGNMIVEEGMLHGTGGMDSFHIVYRMKDENVNSGPGKPGPKWNTMDIKLDGPRTMVFVNGIKVTDYHSKNDIVYFKEISVSNGK